MALPEPRLWHILPLACFPPGVQWGRCGTLQFIPVPPLLEEHGVVRFPCETVTTTPGHLEDRR